ncbi:4'-phosphopantetheinyl transferase family protein [Microbulbifer hydrolyticus]|uniref:Enterobactin synthase component D n=1 Tax=Microbulbifer hydrolyticus TaxID=48074 RepID=A0A6P1T8Q1_9GAMM|nr:4'-phosphopantetheinyl transferase superfamily protein [Microbulbifer hydrolyticus]MBB5211302.1 enterobactin synthetase component D [Microbulbifer hydrolyticus]QHQ37936.1 4'-phosphopantetheinyl transferase superfamily protein [Microbulbifer hydrolyticus]
MQEAAAKIMPRVDRQFIGKVHSEVHAGTGVCLVTCEFDLASYQPELFVELGVAMPESIARSVPKRQAEFLAGRYAAALALQHLAPVRHQDVQVGIGEKRNPLWPTGVVGSISHVDGMAVCAVSHTADKDYLGIDVEVVMSTRVCREVARIVSTRQERELLCGLGLSERVALTLIFSAKESLFKALYPSVRDYFGFEVAEVTELHLEEQTLVLTLTERFAAGHKLPQDYQCQFTQGEHWIQSVTCGKFHGRANLKAVP